MTTIEKGQTVYLAPVTMGAPGVTYQHPRGTVRRVGTFDSFVTVELDSGQIVTTHRRNVVRNRPTPPADRRPRPAPAPPPLIDGVEQPSLW